MKKPAMGAIPLEYLVNYEAAMMLRGQAERRRWIDGYWLPPVETPLANAIPRKTWDGPVLQWKPVTAMTPKPTSGAINLTELLASGQARRVSESAVEIVTPGYHSAPQGDAMPIRCDNPRCPDCYPQNIRGGYAWSPIEINFNNSAAAEAIADAFKISVQDLGLSKQNKEQSMSPVAQRVIADLQSLDEKDFPAISKEIDNIKARRKDSIEENLDGVARMACMDKSTPELRPFVLSYFKDGKVNTVQGVEVGNSSLVKEGEEHKETRVYVFGRDYPVTGTHYTMKIFEKALEKNNIPYAFVYRSK